MADVQLEIAPAGGDHHASLNGWCPDDLAVDKAPDVLQDRVAIVAASAGGGVRPRAQHEGVGTVDTGEAQLTDRLLHRTRIGLDRGRERQHWVAGALTQALDSGRAYPSNTARSSAKAIFRAASFTGDQSESLAPRSKSSIAWRASSNGTRSSTSAFEPEQAKRRVFGVL